MVLFWVDEQEDELPEKNFGLELYSIVKANLSDIAINFNISSCKRF